jgi:excisionase family DNA binding protein
MVQNNQVEEVCPRCNTQLRLLRISKAAQLVDVNKKTIYGYIEEGSVHSVKIAGKTLRICKGCLIQPYDPSQ